MESTEPSGETGLPLWPHYAELWSEILDVPSQVTGRGAVVDGKDDARSETFVSPDGDELKVDLKQFQEFVFDTIIRCIMKTLSELNLKYRVRAIDKQIPSASDVFQGMHQVPPPGSSMLDYTDADRFTFLLQSRSVLYSLQNSILNLYFSVFHLFMFLPFKMF